MLLKSDKHLDIHAFSVSLLHSLRTYWKESQIDKPIKNLGIHAWRVFLQLDKKDLKSTTAFPQKPQGVGSKASLSTKIRRCSNALYNIA